MGKLKNETIHITTLLIIIRVYEIDCILII